MSTSRRSVNVQTHRASSPRRLGAGLGALAVALGVLAPVALVSSPAAAAVVTGAATFQGGLSCDEWRPAVAPPGAISAQFTITGGGGSSGDPQSDAAGGAGGRGGIVSGSISVQGGQRLWAVVGCGGNGWHAGTAKGYAYGGDAGHPAGGGGGAASALCLGTAQRQCAGGDVIAIAGGGGGGGKGTRNSSDGGGSNAGGAGGSASSSGTGSTAGGTSRGGDAGGNGNGDRVPGGGGGASTTGGRGNGGVGANGNRGQGGDGGDGPATGNNPPTALGVVGTGGLSYTVDTRPGGGGGGGLAGGGAGGSGQVFGSSRWNSGAGGGAGSSWYKSTVSGGAFATAAGTANCGLNSTNREAISATNAGFGSATSNGGHGCNGFVTVTWTYENTTINPAVTTTDNTWVWSPSLDQGCSTLRTVALPSSTTHASVMAVGGGGGSGGGGDGGGDRAYGGAGGHGATASIGWSAVPRTGNTTTHPNLNYQVGCGGGNGLSQHGGGNQPGGAGGAGFGNGGEGGRTTDGDNRRASGGGGGGATAVCLGSASASCSAGATLVVAGGGAGGGGSNWGGDNSRSSGGGVNRTNANQTSINSDAGQGGVSRGGYGGGRGRRGSGGGGGGGGAGGPDVGGGSDNDNTAQDGSAGPGNGNVATRGGHRTTGSPTAAQASQGSPARNGGNGGYHVGAGNRKGGGGGGGGGFRGGSGGGSDEENNSGGSPTGGGGGSGSSWVNTAYSPEAFSFAPGGGTGGGTSDANRGWGAGGTPGIPDGNGVAGFAGGVRVLLRGTAITLTTAPGTQTSTVGSAVSTSPVVQNTHFTFQDPSGAATCGCTYTASGLPAGLSMSSAGVVSGTPTTVGSSNVTVTITSSGGTYSTTTAQFTWTVNPRPATQLAFSTQPGDGIDGSPLSVQPVVEFRDSTNALVTGQTSNVTLAIASGTGTLSCTGGTTKAAVGGVATFSGCTVAGTGTFTLSATASGLPVATSSSFQVVPANVAPVADAQSVDVPKRVETPIQLTGTDADDDDLTFAVVTPPTKGVLDCDPDGACTYTSGPGQTGTDSFTFRANDGTVDSAPATVTITIVNNVPVAHNQSIDVEREVETDLQLTGTDDDDDDLTFSVVTPPSKGTVDCDPDGACTYTSDPGEAGEDSFTFRANDGESDSSPATVTIHIANEAPVGTAQDVGLVPDDSAVVTLGGTDADGDAITIQPSLGATAHGTVSGAGATVQYTPDSGFVGVDTFTFTVTDSAGAVSAPATVTVYVGVSALRGTVTTQGSGDPIAGVEVRLIDNSDPLAADPAWLATATSAADGTYDFGPQFPLTGAMLHGDYVIRYVDPTNDHLPEWYENAANRAAATNLEARATSPVLERDAALVPAARITGRVTSTYAPHPAVSGLQVRLVKVGSAGSKAVTTDAEGNYAFELLTEGSYQLWFRDVSSGTWISEWHSNQPTQATAGTLSLATGEQRTVDEQLAPVVPPEPPTIGSIGGRVTAASGGAPVAGIQVRLYKAPYTTSSATTTDANGTYTFGDLPSGSYKVWFRDVRSGQWISEYHADHSTLAAADAIEVDDGPVTVDATVAATVPPTPPSASITGTVTRTDGTTPIAGIQVRLYVAGSASGSMATTTDANGSYAFTGRPPGSYQLWFRDVKSGQWHSEWHEDRSTQDEADPISATNGSPVVVDARLEAR